MTPEPRKKNDEEDDKKALPPLALRGAGREALQLARIGVGSFGGAPPSALAVAFGGFAGKVTLALLVAAASLGAYGVGKQMAQKDGAGLRPRLFASRPSASAAGAGSGLLPDSTKFLRMGWLGADAKARADAKAKAEADAAAAADADAKAKAEADAKAKADAAAAAQSKDAAAAAGAGAKGAPDVGGLSNFGAGKDGGLLDKSKMKGAADALATASAPNPAGSFSGAPLAAGVGRQFDGGKLGAPKAMDANSVASKRASPVKIPSSRARGTHAMRQLYSSNALSRGGAAATTAEGGASAAQQAFDSGIAANDTAGSPIGVRNAPGGSGGKESDYGGNGQPLGGGGGGSLNPSAGSNGTAAPPNAGHVDASPFTGMAMAATGLLLAAGVLLMIGEKMAAAAKIEIASGIPLTVAHGTAMLGQAKILLGMAALMGIGAMGIGGMIAATAQGQLLMGAGLAAGGLLVTLMAAKALFAPTGGTGAIVNGVNEADQAIPANIHNVLPPAPPPPPPLNIV